VNAEIGFEAICCRHINFKTVYQSASEHAIFIQKIETFSGDEAQPSPETPTPLGWSFGTGLRI